MPKPHSVAFGNLKFAKAVNDSKRVNNVLVVIAPTPTTEINPLLRGYHWHAEPDSYFDLFNEVETSILTAKQRNLSPVICAPTKAIAFALSRLHEIGDETDKRSLAEILQGEPKLVEELPRNFRFELALFWGWRRDDEYYCRVASRCWEKDGRFSLLRLLTLSFAELIELQEKTGLFLSKEN